MDEMVFENLEQLRQISGENRSEAIENAVKRYIIDQERKLIARGCKAESEDDLKHAQTSAAIMASIISEKSEK